jgi:hypothetical protein
MMQPPCKYAENGAFNAVWRAPQKPHSGRNRHPLFREESPPERAETPYGPVAPAHKLRAKARSGGVYAAEQLSLREGSLPKAETLCGSVRFSA